MKTCSFLEESIKTDVLEHADSKFYRNRFVIIELLAQNGGFK